jgi:hypothetical protein
LAEMSGWQVGARNHNDELERHLRDVRDYFGRELEREASKLYRGSSGISDADGSMYYEGYYHSKGYSTRLKRCNGHKKLKEAPTWLFVRPSQEVQEG